MMVIEERRGTFRLKKIVQGILRITCESEVWTVMAEIFRNNFSNTKTVLKFAKHGNFIRRK
jgi:hypothetical protein